MDRHYRRGPRGGRNPGGPRAGGPDSERRGALCLDSGGGAQGKGPLQHDGRPIADFMWIVTPKEAGESRSWSTIRLLKKLLEENTAARRSSRRLCARIRSRADSQAYHEGGYSSPPSTTTCTWSTASETTTISTIWATAVSAPWASCLQNQYRIGLSRLERVVRERMTTQEPGRALPPSP